MSPMKKLRGLWPVGVELVAVIEPQMCVAAA